MVLLAVGLSLFPGKRQGVQNIDSQHFCSARTYLVLLRFKGHSPRQGKSNTSHQHCHSKTYADTRDCSGNVSSVCPACLAHGPLSSHRQRQYNGYQPRARLLTASAASDDERGHQRRARPAIAAAASNITTMMYPFPIPSDRDLPKMPEEKGTTQTHKHIGAAALPT